MTHLILTGFMGTGKSVVGRKAAQQLGYAFIDMDEEIEKLAGKPIRKIFQEDGETKFREMEADFCANLEKMDFSKNHFVISTGGGTFLNEANWELLSKNNVVVCLTCSIDEILRRLDGTANDRPLLNVEDRHDQIERLLQARSNIYARIPWQIDTTYLTIDEISGKLCTLVRLKKKTIRFPGGDYPVYLGKGTLELIGEIILATNLSKNRRIAIISNPVVARLYIEKVKQNIQGIGYQVFEIIIPDGEENKNLDTVKLLYDQLLMNNIDRNDLILSLGGGVTSDIAGYVAATYMRGIQFAQIPTTLLAMVDASVGGKTGVDLPQGKNLVGAFKQPKFVLIDPESLVSLSMEETRSGMAELIKHCIIADPELFDELETETAGTTPFSTTNIIGSEWISRALDVKIKIIEEDPFETGKRAVLNFGHTVGHAIEKMSGYQIRHGEAVSIGLVAACKIGYELNMIPAKLVERVERLLNNWGLPVKCPGYQSAVLIAALSHDKKKSGKRTRWILPNKIGKVDIYEEVSEDIIKKVLLEMGAI